MIHNDVNVYQAAKICFVHDTISWKAITKSDELKQATKSSLLASTQHVEMFSIYDLKYD